MRYSAFVENLDLWHEKKRKEDDNCFVHFSPYLCMCGGGCDCDCWSWYLEAWSRSAKCVEWRRVGREETGVLVYRTFMCGYVSRTCRTIESAVCMGSHSVNTCVVHSLIPFRTTIPKILEWTTGGRKQHEIRTLGKLVCYLGPGLILDP